MREGRLSMALMASWIFLRTCRWTAGRLVFPFQAVSAFTTAPAATTIISRRAISRSFAASTKTTTAGGPKRYNRHNVILKKKSDGSREYEMLYRADRVLANRSGMSRSECHELLKNRRVWQQVVSAADNDDDDDDDEFVSGHKTKLSMHADPLLEVVLGPKTKLSMHAKLFIDKVHAVPLPPPLLTVFHKPKWMLSVRSDPLDRPHLDPSLLSDQHPVGRLDYDTSGLLLFSSSGALTQTLLHPKHEIEKEYVAVVTGKVCFKQLREQLAAGVETAAGNHTADLLSVNDDSFPSRISVQDYLDQIRANLPAEYNQTDLSIRGYLDVFAAKELTEIRLTVREGKHRMVRRMLANAGHPVVSLRRERLGVIELGDLNEGAHRRLTESELAWAESLLPKKSRKKPFQKKKKKKI